MNTSRMPPEASRSTGDQTSASHGRVGASVERARRMGPGRNARMNPDDLLIH